MSNALVIAVVTAVIKDILENGLANDAIATSIGETLVTALPPDRITVGSDERPQLNVFLYQVSQNRNADWVGRDRADTRPGQTALALDLHYLLTAYGAKDFQAELLLGYAMQLFHEIPVLTQEMVQTALKHAADVQTFGVLSQVLTSLSVSQVAEQIGSIKLHPEFFSMEETSKLWSSLQTHYRPSAAYQASMVLIQSRRASAPTEAIDLQQPVIEQVSTRTSAPTSGETVVLRGKHLQGALTRLRLTGRSALLTPQDVRETQISLTLPPDLPAGIQGVQVVHVEMNPRLAVGQEIESNMAAFVLHPAIAVRLNASQPVEDDLRKAELTLTVRPVVGRSQRVLLLLHDRQGNRVDRFPVAPRDADTDTLVVPVHLPAGTYWVQLQVDGALSSITPDASQVSIP